MVYQVVCSHGGKEKMYDVEASHYKVSSESSSYRNVTFYKGDQQVGTFFEVCVVRAIKTGPVIADPEVRRSLNGLIDKNKDEEEDEYGYPFLP